MARTDFILVRCRVGDDALLAGAARAFCAAGPWPMALHRVAWSATAQLAYVYARLPAPTEVDDAQREALARAWQQACPGAQAVDVARLASLFDAPGRSVAETAVNHYVVETDAEDGWMDEISRWYDTEHMPGLAAVPGCVHARRLRNLDSGPQSLACYDLVNEETLGSPPWLAVRGTKWSDIARPHFVNTRRTMMRVVA